MRIMVVLSPTNKRGTKMPYTELRKFLTADGYQRIGPELFMRIVTNRKSADTHIGRLKLYDLGIGTVRVLKLTEKQYANVQFITHEPDPQDEVVGSNCHVSI